MESSLSDTDHSSELDQSNQSVDQQEPEEGPARKKLKSETDQSVSSEADEPDPLAKLLESPTSDNSRCDPF